MTDEQIEHLVKRSWQHVAMSNVLGKWMHDFDAENRFESDYFTLTGAWSF